MLVVRETDVFSEWMATLRDRQARARINRRIDRLSLGNFGDVKSLGAGISALRVDYGPGYCLYFTMVVLLLCGGHKSRQERDIAKARRLAQREGKQ